MAPQEASVAGSGNGRTKTALFALSLYIFLMAVGSPFSANLDNSRSLSTAAATAAAAIKEKPNILLFVLDQWRYDWDGMHPDTPTGPLPLRMPFLESVAKRGTRFTQAYVPSPLCAPVRACLASGKEYDEAGVYDNHADSYLSLIHI